MRRFLVALGFCLLLVSSANAQRPAYNPYAKQTEEDFAAVRPDGKLNWPAFFKSKAMEDRFKVYFAQGSCTGTNMRIVNALEANKVYQILDGKQRTVTSGWGNASGLAWHPGTGEIWFSPRDLAAGSVLMLCAVSPAGTVITTDLRREQ